MCCIAEPDIGFHGALHPRGQCLSDDLSPEEEAKIRLRALAPLQDEVIATVSAGCYRQLSPITWPSPQPILCYVRLSIDSIREA
jgi:hypothetical protein